MRSIIALCLALGLAATALAAPEAKLWKRWTAHEAASEKTIDHSAYTAVLETYIVRDETLALNRFRYGAVTAEDQKALDAYLERMQGIEISQHNRAVQRAYWTNLYNALTLDLVLKAYPVESIRDIGGGLFSSGPWSDTVATVEGVELTLNDIEHRILRPIWDDPLNHYGVNCASVSCPNLLKQAYTSDNIERLLRENARDYVNSSRGVRIENGEVTASKIYEWFQADFGGTETAVINHIRQFAGPERAARLDVIGEIDDYAYDWSLNDAE